MRGLLLALVLANVAFFGWAHWIDVSPAAQASTPASTLPLLALADSGNAGAAGAGAAGIPAAAHPQQGAPAGPAVQGAARGGKDAHTRCRSLGPFPGAAAGRVAADLLRARQLVPRTRTVDISLAGGTVSAYWLDLDLGANEPDPPLAALRAGTDGAGTGAAARVTAARAATALRGVAFSDCPVASTGG